MTTQLKENYKSILQRGICEVVFTKANGDEREMVCTLHPGELPPPVEANPENPTKPRPPEPDEVITVWDMEAQGWRRFIIANVVEAPRLIEEIF